MSDPKARRKHSSEPLPFVDPHPTILSPQLIPSSNRVAHSASVAVEEIKRKAVGAQISRPSVYTSQTAMKQETEAPTSASSWEAAFQTPTTTTPWVGSRPAVPLESRTRRNSSSSLYQKPPNSNPHPFTERPGPQGNYAGYSWGDEDGGRFLHNLDTLSTLSMNQPAMRSHPPSPSPLTPSRESIIKQQQPEQEPKSISIVREILLVVTICLAHFLTQACLSQSIAPLPLITSSFTTPTHVPSPSWYSAAYSLAVGTFILPSGRLGDVYGHKRVFIIGWLWFAVASLGAGLNPTVQGSTDEQGNVKGQEIFFCVCRALQGIGPAILMPNGLAILGRTYPDGNRKNMAFSLFGASAPIGFVVGSVMSSLLAQKTHWAWAFRVLAIACVIVAIASIPIIPSLRGTLASSTASRDLRSNSNNECPKKETVPLWKQLDILGTILGVSGLVLVNVAVNQAALVKWSTPYTYFLLLLGLIILGFFFFFEFTPTLTSHPLIPSAILSIDTVFVLVCIACGWATFSIWIYYIWEFLERVRSLSPLLASAQFSPAALSGLLAALSTGFLLSKTTPQIIMALSMCAFFTGTTLIATAPASQTYWAQAFLSIIIMPWGMDMSFPSATILLSAKAGPETQGVAMSLVNTVVNYSISLGLGLAATVHVSVDSDGSQLLRGFRSAWYFAMGLSALGIALAVLYVAMGAWKAMRDKRTVNKELKESEVGNG